MTLVQLEYIVAVDTYRHFAVAAANCFVTQPTLSMQIQKLEAELGIKLFDRSKQPVVPTALGSQVITQARKVLTEKNQIDELIQSEKGVITGELKIGIIPTLAPYLLPLFVQSFIASHPQVKLIVTEMTTDHILLALKESRIDVGILVTPLHENGIKEHVLFYEELVAFASTDNPATKKQELTPADINPDTLWLLEEGHCFRAQILNLCDLRKGTRPANRFQYEAGSFETLRRFVEINKGITLLPELATADLSTKQQQLVRHFAHPAPMREVSLVIHRDFVKKRLVEVLEAEILKSLPEKITSNTPSNIVPIEMGRARE